MRRPSRISVRRLNDKWSETRFRFAGGIRATVVQPHLHGHGRLLVVGDRGAIADYQTDRTDARHIGYLVEEGVYRGVTVDGERVPSERDDLFFANLPRAGGPKRTLDNMFKIRGFMELVAALADEQAEPRYDPFDAIYDHQALRVAERAPAFVDPRLPGGRSVFASGLRLAAAMRPARAARASGGER
jgi:hypothetical protein